MHKDFITVATNGTIDRHNRCSSCGHDMFYHVNASGKADHMFCHNVECMMWLKEVVIIEVKNAR
jgi:hypothetical protein